MSDTLFRYEPDPDDPDWMVWEIVEPGRFNQMLGALRVRRDDERRARCRMWPERQHSNLADKVHGGVVMSFIDVALFAGSRALGIDHAGRAVTLDLSVQFIVPGEIGAALDAEVEVLRETRRLVFLRGLVVQGELTVAGFSGTIRKAAG